MATGIAATCMALACGTGNNLATSNQSADPAPSATGAARPAKTNANKQEPAKAAEFPTATEYATATLTHKVIDAPEGTFGYDILSNSRLIIHQTNLPGMPGVEGCKTSGDAEKLARLVMAKIQRGHMPPSITPAELDSLGIH